MHPYDPEIEFIGADPTEMHTNVHQDACIGMFKATLFILAQI